MALSPNEGLKPHISASISCGNCVGMALSPNEGLKPSVAIDVIGFGLAVGMALSPNERVGTILSVE